MAALNWGIGDLLAVTKLAWDLYHGCYLVAKDAPDDFRQLVNELASLQGVLRTLRDDVNSDASFLDKLGENRKEMLERCLQACFETLRKLQDLVVKYRKLGINDGAQFWKKLKWVGKKGEVAALRSRVMVHTCNISLCMSSIGNSSLQRLETNMMRALERQDETAETVAEDDELTPLTRAQSIPTDPGDVGPEGLGLKSLRRQFTGSTLVDRPTPSNYASQELTPSLTDDDNSDFGSPGKNFATPRQSSLSSIKPRRQSGLAVDRQARLSPPSPVPSDDGTQLRAASIEKQRMSGGKEMEPDLKDAVAEAFGVLSNIRQKERAARPLRVVPQHPVHRPDDALRKCFSKLADEEMEFRRMTARDWLRVATWWLLKADFNMRTFERPRRASSHQGSFSPSSDSRSPSTQAYLDLLKSSWILYDIILKGDNPTMLLTDENRKLFHNLSDGISEQFNSFTQVDIPDRDSFHRGNLNLWELQQPEEDSYDDDDGLLPGLDNLRFITVDQEDAGEEDEVVLFRTFVNAAIGGKKKSLKSRGAPYLLLLSTKEGESEPKVTLCNQSGTLCLTRDFVKEDLDEENIPPTSPASGMSNVPDADPFKLDFGRMSVAVVLTTDHDLHAFLGIPRAYFQAVKRRESRQLEKATEALLFKSSVDVYEELQVSTMKAQSPRKKYQSCDLRILETTCQEGWRTTRRLVVSSSASEKKLWCKELFLPLSRVQIRRDGLARQVTIKWSDCSHQLPDQTDGNYNPVYTYVYDDSSPNIALSLSFRNMAAATEFENIVLHLSHAPTHSFTDNNILYNIYPVIDKEPNPKNYKALLFTRSISDWKYSELFYMYRDTDYVYDRHTLRVRFPQVYYTDYISTHVGRLSGPNMDTEAPHFSHCERKLNTTSVQFESEASSFSFMSALTSGHELVFSRRAHSIIKAPGRLLSIGSSKSNKGPPEVQLWRKSSPSSSICLISRWDDRVEDKWISMTIPRSMADGGVGVMGRGGHRDSNRITIEKAPYERGRQIDMAGLIARNPREKENAKKMGSLIIAFETVRDQNEFAAALEGTTLPGNGAQRSPFDDLMDMP